MNTVPANRIQWIDFSKLLAVILMTWGHCIMNMGLDPDFHYKLGNSGWIYTFHMPLFMVLSGFVSFKVLEGKGNIVRKFEQLIIPCCVYFAIQSVIPVYNNLWFLKSLFISYAVCVLLYYVKSKLKTSWKVIVCGALPICFLMFPIICHIPYIITWKIDFMFPFFAFGLFLHAKCDWVMRHLLPMSISSMILFVAMLVIFSPDSIWYVHRSCWIDFAQLVPDGQACDGGLKGQIYSILAEVSNGGSLARVWNPQALYYSIYRMVAGLAGSMTVICFSIYLERLFGEKFTKVARFGKYSLHVYMLQNFVFVICGIFKISFPAAGSFVYSFVLCPIMAIIMVVLYIVIAMLLEKNYLVNRYLFGKI